MASLRERHGAAGVAVALVALAFTARASDEAERPVYAVWGDSAKGRTVYQRKDCALCHAINGVGGRVGPDLARAKEPLTLTQIAGVMWNHAPEMRRVAREKGIEWRAFSGTEMRDLVSYLYFLRSLDRPGDARRGAGIFDRKRCSSCHAIGGNGSRIGPDLAQFSKHESPILWAESMWNHALEMDEKLRQMGLPWPTFSGDEMVDLVAYVKSEASPKR